MTGSGNGGYIGFTPSPTTAATSASGVWTLPEVLRFRKQDKWPVLGNSNPVLSNLVLWLRSDLGALDSTSSPIATDGTAVATWTNQANSGQNAGQSTSSARPVWRSPINGINGVPVIQFDGISNILTGSDAGFPSGAASRTAYWVSRYRSLNANWGGWSYGATGSSNAVFGQVKTNTNYAAVQGWATDYPSSYLIAANTVYVHSAVLSGTSLTQFVNGTSVYSGTSSLNTTLANFRIGAEQNASAFQPVDVMEILLYSTAHNSTDRAAIENYLKTKAGI